MRKHRHVRNRCSASYIQKQKSGSISRDVLIAWSAKVQAMVKYGLRVCTHLVIVTDVLETLIGN